MTSNQPLGDRPDQIDDGVGRVLAAYSQRLSRRNLLRRVAASTVGAAFATLIIDAEAVANVVAGHGYNESDWHDCALWDRRWMCGYSCNCCNGAADNPEDCPSCAVEDVQHSWTMCMPNDSGVSKKVRYVDCVSNGNCSGSKISACYSCSGCNDGCSVFDEIHNKPAGWDWLCVSVNRLGNC